MQLFATIWVDLKGFMLSDITQTKTKTAWYHIYEESGWRSLVGCSPWDCEESDTTERLHFHFSLSCIGERNGNTLQCSCLENPRDGGAWWAAVYGVAHSRTWLKRLSSSSSSSYVVLADNAYASVSSTSKAELIRPTWQSCCLGLKDMELECLGLNPHSASY